MKNEKKELLKKRDELLDQIEKHGDFIKGSISRISRNGVPINGYNMTSKNRDQKTVTKYISEKQLKSAQKSIKNMEKVKNLIDKISRLNMEILKLS